MVWNVEPNDGVMRGPDDRGIGTRKKRNWRY